MGTECRLQFFHDGFACIAFGGNCSLTEKPDSPFQPAHCRRRTQHRQLDKRMGRSREPQTSRTAKTNTSPGPTQDHTKVLIHEASHARFMPRSALPRDCPGPRIAMATELASTCVWDGHELARLPRSYACDGQIVTGSRGEEDLQAGL